MAAVAWLLDDRWAPSDLRPTPILTDQITYSFDHSRPLLRYVRYVDRNAILKDFFARLARLSPKTPRQLATEE